ncbi:MAG: septum formation initiator family protein [Candidatus Firestonebacteria bacterium]|nr:septum formation initiator family protein [Candidatus Firestonebacteria bacterium]
MSNNRRFRTYNTAITSSGKVRVNDRRLKDKIFRVIMLLLLLAYAYFVLAGNAGLVHLVKAKLEKTSLEKQIEVLEESNKKAAFDIKALKSDLKSVERLAREELGLIKKGEVVYKFIIKKEDKNVDTGDRNSDKR